MTHGAGEECRIHLNPTNRTADTILFSVILHLGDNAVPFWKIRADLCALVELGTVFLDTLSTLFKPSGDILICECKEWFLKMREIFLLMCCWKSKNSWIKKNMMPSSVCAARWSNTEVPEGLRVQRVLYKTFTWIHTCIIHAEALDWSSCLHLKHLV